MNQLAVEAYLARLYTDATARAAFLADPVGAARNAGLSDEDANCLRGVDLAGLRMAAASYTHKREQHRRPKKTLVEVWRDWLAKRRPHRSRMET